MSEQAGTKADPKRTAWYLKPKAILTAIAAVILLILVFQNWESVSVRIFFWTQSVPASLMYVFFAVAGFVAARITLRTKPKEGGSKSK